MLGLVLHDVVGQEAKGVLGPDASTTDTSTSDLHDADRGEHTQCTARHVSADNVAFV